MIDILNISTEFALGWTSQELTDDESTLIQVMVRVMACRVTASTHYIVLIEFFDAIWRH